MSSTATVHEIERARQRVTVGPRPEWAVLHPIDEGWRAPGGLPYSLLLRDEQHHAGAHAIFIRQVQRLETLHAVHESAQWKFDFDPAIQRVTLHSLAVRRAGSESEHAAPEKFRFLQREASVESRVIDGTVSLLVLLEDVRVGDLLEVCLTVTSEPLLFAEHCFGMTFPPTNAPLRAWRWSVRFDPARPMRWKSGPEGFAPETRTLPTGETEWQWSLEKGAAELEETDVPSSCLPSRWVQISDFASWAEVSAGILACWHEELESDELRAFVADLAARAPTLPERVSEAISMVQDEIRYLSVNLELGSSIPSRPASVLQKRFGDTKDKSFLLAHVLRRLGASARPVLVHSRLRGTIGELLPAPAFNHAVVEFELAGHRIWVNPTIPMQGGDAFSRWVPTWSVGLPIGPGVDQLETQPAARKPGRLTLNEHFGVDEAAGQSRMVMTMRGTGSEADALRRRVLMHSAEAFAEDRLQVYRQFFPRARLLGKVEWRDDRRLNEFRVGLHVSLPLVGADAEGSGASTFAYCAHLLRAGLHVPSGDSRKAPLQVAGERVVLEHIIEMMGTPAQTGSATTMSAKHDSFVFSGSTENRLNSLLMRFSLTILRDQIRPGELRTFRAQLEKLWSATAVRLVIFRGFKTSMMAKKAGNIFPVERSPLAAPPVAIADPLPAEPAAALGPRPLNSGASPSDLPAAKPIPYRTPELDPDPESGPAEDATPRRRGKQRRARRGGPGSRLWILLVLAGAAILTALIAILIH